MISFQLSVPSKTFLLGEYVALQGGPSILLTTSPRFQLIATNQDTNQLDIHGINLASPAGKLIQADTSFYQNYTLNFIDPYSGLGGFGASSAQFLLAFVLRQYLQEKEVNETELLNEYKNVAWDGEGLSPSGVDLIAQLHGGLYFHWQKQNQSASFSWPFTDLDYCLIHTNNKLEIHLHLKNLPQLNVSELETIANEGFISLEDNDSEKFVVAIKKYARVLKKENLVTENTKNKLEELSANQNILAVKGCGAMGADVIAVIYKRKVSSDVIAWLTDRKFHIIAYGNSVENGLEFKTLINEDQK